MGSLADWIFGGGVVSLEGFALPRCGEEIILVLMVCCLLGGCG